MTVFVTINGELRELPFEATVASVVELLARDGGPAAVASRGVAVALDNEIVPRGRWSTTTVTDGARVEIVAAIQGGST